jgi:hypothetical protein
LGARVFVSPHLLSRAPHSAAIPAPEVVVPE